MLFQKKTAISFPSYDPERQQAVLNLYRRAGRRLFGQADRAFHGCYADPE